MEEEELKKSLAKAKEELQHGRRQAAINLYRSYIGGAETDEERLKRINRFRRG